MSRTIHRFSEVHMRSRFLKLAALLVSVFLIPVLLWAGPQIDSSPSGSGVPYSGATQELDLGSQNMKTTGSVSGGNVVVGAAALGPATTKMYHATALTGGGSGALDSIAIAGLTDGDFAIYSADDGGSGLTILYRFYASATDATASPGKIRPADYATAGVWYSCGLGGQGVPTYRARASFNPNNVYDNDATNHWLTLEPRVPAAITITRIYVSLDIDPTTELTVTFKECDVGIGCANASTIEAVTTVSGVANITTGIDDAAIAAGKKIIVVLSDPDAAILTADVLLEGTY